MEHLMDTFEENEIHFWGIIFEKGNGEAVRGGVFISWVHSAAERKILMLLQFSGCWAFEGDQWNHDTFLLGR